MTTILAIGITLIAVTLLLRFLARALPILAIIGLLALSVCDDCGLMSVLAAHLLVLIIALAGFWIMLRGLFR